jgi:hypothetical protein
MIFNKRSLPLCFALACLLTSTSTSAFHYGWKEKPFDRTSLRGINNIAINIDTRYENTYNRDLKYKGVTKKGLYGKIEEKLKNNGFNVVSLGEAIEDPDAVLLNLRMRVNLIYYAIYSYELYLTVQQKVLLSQNEDENNFFSVNIWEDGNHGGLGQGELSYLNVRTLEIVDKFIRDHNSQSL